MKCKRNCIFYLDKLDNCMLCDYTSSDQLSPDYIREVIFKTTGEIRCNEQEKKSFDILELDDDECDEWSQRKILNRLHNHGIDAYFCDMFGCDEVAWINGINIPATKTDEIARILGIHEECIYYDIEHSFMILNLFQEKILRERK